MSARVSEAHHVGVIGAGTMGAGIATSCLAGGLRVTLVDSQSAALASGLRRIHEALDAAVNKGRLTPEARAAAEVAVANDIAALGAADVVIEAVFENLQLKQDVFRELDARCRAATLLATNTSTLDVAAIASVTARPQDVIGMHFFSPANIMRLVEIVRAAETSSASVVNISGNREAARLKIERQVFFTVESDAPSSSASSSSVFPHSANVARRCSLGLSPICGG